VSEVDRRHRSVPERPDELVAAGHACHGAHLSCPLPCRTARAASAASASAPAAGVSPAASAPSPPACSWWRRRGSSHRSGAPSEDAAAPCSATWRRRHAGRRQDAAPRSCCRPLRRSRSPTRGSPTRARVTVGLRAQRSPEARRRHSRPPRRRGAPLPRGSSAPSPSTRHPAQTSLAKRTTNH
jgi:hypothetical protein